MEITIRLFIFFAGCSLVIFLLFYQPFFESRINIKSSYFLLFSKNYRTNQTVRSDVSQTVADEKNVLQFSRTIKMVFYTKFFDDPIWPYFYPYDDYQKSCNFDFKCKLIYNRSQYENADVVFFHGRNMPGVGELQKMKTKVKNKTQFWVYFVLENPWNSPPIKPLNKYFDFVSGYRYSSDFHFPYGYYDKLSKSEQLSASKVRKNYAQNKTKKIAWFVSHCGAIREKLVNRFVEMDMPIDVAGGCAHRYKHKMTCKDRSCRVALKDYKFYFSAENNLCNEYVSEKYWHTALENEIIPIVLGGSNYSDPKMAIPGSYINALDFKSPKELVEYIRKVDSNDTLYNQYFEWKKTYRSTCEYYGCSKRLNDFCTKLHDGIHIRKNPLISTIKADEECASHEKYYHEWVKR